MVPMIGSVCWFRDKKGHFIDRTLVVTVLDGNTPLEGCTVNVGLIDQESVLTNVTEANGQATFIHQYWQRRSYCLPMVLVTGQLKE